MSYDEERCGTRAGSQRHWRRGETPCEPCRAAAAAEMAKRRAADPTIARRSATTARVRARALTALAHMHPGDYADLLAEYRFADDLDTLAKETR